MSQTASRPVESSPDPPLGGHRPGWSGLEVVVACATALVVGFRYRLPPDIPIGFLLAGALLPVTIGMWRRYAGARLLTLTALLAAVSGLFLTWDAAIEGWANLSLTIVQTSRVVGLALGVLALLWARSVVGTRVTVLMYGLGALLTVGYAGINFANPWKFSFSVPIALLVLSLPWVYQRKHVEALALAGLGAVSVLNDSRSAAAMFLIGAAVVLTRRGRSARRAGRGMASVAFRLAVFGVGGFYLVQAAAVEGVLGEGAQQRTLEQIDRSGSVLVGGRPELGATIALVTERPLGYGAGALASPEDITTAKNGMAALGYDPNNGYVENYMFGYGFEVHSFLGDLWILYGSLGAMLAVLVLVAVVSGLVRGLAAGTASGVLVFLALRTVWDFAFSPFPSVMNTVMLALAIALVPRSSDRVVATDEAVGSRDGSGGESGRPGELGEPRRERE